MISLAALPKVALKLTACQLIKPLALLAFMIPAFALIAAPSL